jgi:hypothetical protein
MREGRSGSPKRFGASSNPSNRSISIDPLSPRRTRREYDRLRSWDDWWLEARQIGRTKDRPRTVNAAVISYLSNSSEFRDYGDRTKACAYRIPIPRAPGTALGLLCVFDNRFDLTDQIIDRFLH